MTFIMAPELASCETNIASGLVKLTKGIYNPFHQEKDFQYEPLPSVYRFYEALSFIQ